MRCKLRAWGASNKTNRGAQYGFAVSQRFHGDLFIHSDNAPGLQLREGMEIEVTIGEDDRQRITGYEITEPRADSLRPGPEGRVLYQ